MTIFTDLKTSRKLAKYIQPKEGHKFYWLYDKFSGADLCFLHRDNLYLFASSCIYGNVSKQKLKNSWQAYTFEQILEEIGEKVYSVGFVMTKEHILYIHFSAKLQDCKEFKSDSILQSAVEALIWVYEQKENKQ